MEPVQLQIIYCLGATDIAHLLVKKVCIPYNLIRQNKQKGIPMKQYNSNQKKDSINY